MGLKDLSIGRQDEFKIPLKDIHVEPGWNARDLDTPEELEGIKELAASMVGVGNIKPLTVVFKGDKCYVRDGHRRLRAAVYANLNLGTKIASANCVTLPRGADEADYLVLQVLEDKTKSPLELGSVYKRLLNECGMTIPQISDRVGKSVTHVSNCLELQSAPVAVKALVKGGQVSSTLAAKVVKEQGPKATKVLEDAVDTARQQGRTRATAKHVGQEPKVPRKNALTRAHELLSGGEGTRIDTTGVGVKIIMNDRAYAELATILDLED